MCVLPWRLCYNYPIETEKEIMKTAIELAAEYCRLMNASVKAYRIFMKSKNIKMKSNGGACHGAATYSTFTMKQENIDHIAKNIAEPKLRRFYAELNDPVMLLRNCFPVMAEGYVPEFDQLAESLYSIRAPFQSEWDSFYKTN